MKALKIWAFLLLGIGAASYLYGVFSGVFNRMAMFWILYGTSETALGLSLTSLFCLILSISLFFVLHALREKEKGRE